VCRLSGARPGLSCPTTVEWFAPGQVPTDTCRWHDASGDVTLPAEYAEWMELVGKPRRPRVATPELTQASAPSNEEFRIVSPRDSDVYRLPPGVEGRYATVALRAAGGRPGADVRWTVDGRPHPQARWTLRPGRHRFRAVSAAGDSAEVAVSVE
jgi:hypothetical protein